MAKRAARLGENVWEKRLPEPDHLPWVGIGQFSARYRAQTLATLSQSVVYRGDRFPRRICHDFVTPSAANRNVPRPYFPLIESSVAISVSLRPDAWLLGTNNENC